MVTAHDRTGTKLAVANVRQTIVEAPTWLAGIDAATMRFSGFGLNGLNYASFDAKVLPFSF